MKQQIPNLREPDLIEANEMVADLRKLKPLVRFPKVCNHTSVCLCSFTDAAHTKGRDYGQSFFSTGVLPRERIAGKDVTCTIDWSSPI